jgi:S1-C subfamily serine protease
MLRKAMTLLVVLAAVAAVSGCREGEQPGAATQPTAPSATAKPAARATGPAAPAPVKPSAGQEEIVLTLTLPPANEEITTKAVSGHGACPLTTVSALLGVQVTRPHGMVIGRVLPEGLGAKAGIKPGDSIVKADGVAVSCPQAFVPYLQRTDQPRAVQLTILRPKAPAAQPAPAEQTPEAK